MKASWKIWAVIGLVAIISITGLGVAYADGGSVTSDCQSQSLCIFSSVTCSTSSTAKTTATINPASDTITFTITNDYPGYDALISFVISNKSSTPGVVSAISYINPNTYFTMTPITGITQGQIINANGKASGTFDIDFSSNAPNSTMGQTYRMSLSIMVTQYAPPNLFKTSTCLSSTPNPSKFGQSVNFTAKVSPSTVTGSVTFYNGSSILSSNIPLISGSASISVSTLTIGSHNITAIYNGNSSFATSTSNTINQKVLGKTTITWPHKPNPCNFGQTCTFSVQVGWQGIGTPTGYMTFYDGSNSVGTCNLSDNGTATLSCYLSAGSHGITAVYSGDNNNDGSASDVVSQTVNKVNSINTLITSPNPTNYKTTVTFTATISPSMATGTVAFKDGDTTIGTGILNGGKATFSTNLSVGTHSITAVYSGDGNCNASASTVVRQVITAR
jgi:hypothetical protein